VWKIAAGVALGIVFGLSAYAHLETISWTLLVVFGVVGLLAVALLLYVNVDAWVAARAQKSRQRQGAQARRALGYDD
jgi:hypothetical protein